MFNKELALKAVVDYNNANKMGWDEKRVNELAKAVYGVARECGDIASSVWDATNWLEEEMRAIVDDDENEMKTLVLNNIDKFKHYGNDIFPIDMLDDELAHLIPTELLRLWDSQTCSLDDDFFSYWGDGTIATYSEDELVDFVTRSNYNVIDEIIENMVYDEYGWCDLDGVIAKLANEIRGIKEED